MTLRDASAYNVQFEGGRPVFIDTLSFEPRKEGAAWAAYRQFCEHFLVPLALMSRVDIDLGDLLRTHIDGIPLELGNTLLGSRTWRSLGLLFHVRAPRHGPAALPRPGARHGSPAQGDFADGAGPGPEPPRAGRAPDLESRRAPSGPTTRPTTTTAPRRRGPSSALVTGMLRRHGSHDRVGPGRQHGRLQPRGAHRGGPGRRRSTSIRPRSSATTAACAPTGRPGSCRSGWTSPTRRPRSGGPTASASRSSSAGRRTRCSRWRWCTTSPSATTCRSSASPASSPGSAGRWSSSSSPRATRRCSGCCARAPDIFPAYTREGFEAAFRTSFRIEAVEPVSGSERLLYLMVPLGALKESPHDGALSVPAGGSPGALPGGPEPRLLHPGRPRDRDRRHPCGARRWCTRSRRRLLRGRGAGLPAFVAFLAVLWLFGFDPAAHRLPHVCLTVYSTSSSAWSAWSRCVALVRWLARRPPSAPYRLGVPHAHRGPCCVLRFGAGIVTDHWRQREGAGAQRHRAAARGADPRRRTGTAAPRATCT